MIEYLLQIDEDILLMLNGIRHELLDPFWKIFSGKVEWIPLYLAIAFALVRTFGWKRGLILIVAIGLAAGCSDLTCARLIRPFFERLRPSHPDNPVSVLVQLVDGYRGGRFGFPSCHATNTFALALASSLMLRNAGYSTFIFCWAILQCYSRIYLGVHYPGDLIVGAAIGSAYAYLAYIATKKWSKAPAPDNIAVFTPIAIGSLTIITIGLFAAFG